MTIKKIRQYRKATTGNLVFVHEVSGTEKELAEFKEAQGENYIEDEKSKKPLWFSTRYALDKGTLLISKAGKAYADTSELDAAASMVAQYGGNLGQELARASVQKIMGFTPEVVQAPMPQNQNGSGAGSLDSL